MITGVSCDSTHNSICVAPTMLALRSAPLRWCGRETGLKDATPGIRHEGEVSAFTCHMAEAGKIQMHPRDTQVIGCCHVHDAAAGDGCLRTVHVNAGHAGIGIYELDALEVYEIAPDQQRLAARGDQPAGVPRRMTRRWHGGDA